MIQRELDRVRVADEHSVDKHLIDVGTPLYEDVGDVLVPSIQGQKGEGKTAGRPFRIGPLIEKGVYAGHVSGLCSSDKLVMKLRPKARCNP